VERARHARGVAIAATVATAALVAVGLPRVRWNDDVFAFERAARSRAAAEDRELREAVRQPELGRLVAAFGADDEAALRANDAAAERLETLRGDGALEGFRSLHAWIWSRDLQQRNGAVLAAQPDLAGRMDGALAAAGFRTEAFAGFAAALRGPAPPPLAMADLLASPFADAIAPFRLELADGRVALLTFLRGCAGSGRARSGRRRSARRAFLRSAGIRALALRAVSHAQRAARRGRGGRRRAAARAPLPPAPAHLGRAAPALLAAAVTLALFGLGGTPVSLLHLLGLLLVLSLGVDYGIFLVESPPGDADGDASLLSVTLDCATTLLSFGLLATSSFPALSALGTSTAVGVAASLVFALSFRALLPERARRGGEAQ
jgi:predicted exporter